MFDLDGTLVDSVPDLHAAVVAMQQDLGELEATLEQVTSWVGNGAAVLVKRALSHSVDICENLCNDKFDKAYQLFIKHYHAANGNCAALYDGVHELFEYLNKRNIHIAIITNKPEQFTHPLLEKLNIQAKLVLSGDSLQEKKPHPAPLLECLKHFDISSQEAVMIGDSVSDISAAKAANVPSIAVSYGYNHGQCVSTLNADRVIDSLRELIE